MQPGLEDTRANADALILGETLPADNRDHEPAAQATSPEARVHEGHSSPPSSREPPPTRVSPSSPDARPSSPSASRPPLLETRLESRSEEELFGTPRAELVQVGRVGRFLLLRELGRGAMGVVYLAFDEELERRVALKLLHYDRADGPAGHHQLLREAQALARLMHPNVVAVHEAGVWQGCVFLVMEYVAGQDLDAWLERAERPWREVIKVLSQAGAGLQAAHEAGLVHRDFKPSNVLVGDDGRARVADFGLVTLQDSRAPSGAAASSVSRLAETIAGAGALVGTPAYMAPEQTRRETTTVASDQFSYCVVLYEALYGYRPFSGDELSTLAVAIQSAETPLPPQDSKAPAWLFPVLLRGLAKAPDERYPSIAALLDELRRDPDLEHARRRRVASVALLTATLCALAIFVGLRVYDSLVRARSERRAAERLALLVERLESSTSADEGAQLVSAFVEQPENEGTAAIARAYIAHARQLDEDPGAALDAYARGFLSATRAEDATTALRGIVPQLIAAGRAEEADVALRTLERRAPEFAHDPGLADARLHAALRLRDLRVAREVIKDLPLDHSARSYAALFESWARATSVPSRKWFVPDPTAESLSRDGTLVLAAAIEHASGDFALLNVDAALSERARVTPPDAPVETVRPLPFALAGAPMLLTSRELGKAGGMTRTHRHSLLELQPDGSSLTRYSWMEDALTEALVADLDGDGQRELYTGSGPYTRALSRLDRDAQGAWRRGPVMESINALRSDVQALESGDLNGDGRDELLVALGPWSAYDLRVLRQRDDGRFELVSRRTVGLVHDLALLDVGGERWIAALKQDELPNESRFSRDAPYGPPSGIYLFALRGGELEQVGYSSPRALPSIRRFEYPLLAGDFDGDGLDDLVVSASEADASARDVVVFRQGAGELLAPLPIHGFFGRAALELDGDPAIELLVDELLEGGPPRVLGLGDELLPSLTSLVFETRDPPTSVDDPAARSAWEKAEELAAIGLPARSAEALAKVAGLGGPAREDFLYRAGEHAARAGEHAVAAAHFLAAAARPRLAADALAGAIRSYRALGELVEEARVTAELVALPSLSTKARRDAEQALRRLQRATEPRARVELDFARPLDRRWRIEEPLALARVPERGGLVVESAFSTIAALPLRHDGGAVSLQVELEVDHMEWGTALGISLGGDEPVILLRLSSEGNTARHECVIQGAPERGEVELRLPRPPSGPISLRHVLYPELGLERIELEVSGRLVARRVRALKAGVLSSRPELRLLGESLGRFYSARGVVRSITLEGLSIADEPDSSTPDASARQLVEGELLDALESMPSVEALEPGDRRLLWRSVALAELGRVDDATEALRRGASGDDASFEIRIVFQVQRNKSDLWQLAARRALGSRWVFFRYGDRNLDHSRRPGEVRETIAALSDVPLELDAAATPEQASGLAAALAIRGDAWFRNGQLERAVRDFDAAMPILERPDLRDTEHIRRTAARRRLELAVRRRDRQDTLIQLRRVLALSVAPMILIENSRVKPEYASLLRSADWDTLEAELSERSLLASPAASANASKQEE